MDKRLGKKLKKKEYPNSEKGQKGSVDMKAFISESKKKIKNKESLGLLTFYTDLLYENPYSFIDKLGEMKEALKTNEDYFDAMDTSLFYHYFIAMESAKVAKKQDNYDILEKHYIKFLDFFSDKLDIRDTKGNTLLHFLAKNGNIEVIEKILDHFLGKNVINLKTPNNNHELVLNFVLQRSKKDVFLKFYEKYSQSYDLLSLSEVPEFQQIIKILTSYEKDIFCELQTALKDKDYDRYLNILDAFKVIELKTLIFYQNISYTYFEVFIENNLEGHLKRFLSMIEEKCPESIEKLFQDQSNILILALKSRTAKKELIKTIFRFYTTHEGKLDPATALVNKKKMNIIHLLMLNKSLGIEDQKEQFNTFKYSFSQEIFKKMVNSKDSLGNYPFNYILSSLSNYHNEIPSGYSELVNQLIIDTDLQVFTQDLSRNEAALIYKQVEFDKKLTTTSQTTVRIKKRLIKNYISHPSLCLGELSDPQQIMFMIDFLGRNKLLDLFVIDKIREMSVLDVLMMKKFDANVETTKLYDFIFKYASANPKTFSIFDEKYCYYLHSDSLLNLVMKCSVDVDKINFAIHLLNSLEKEDISRFSKFKIKKQMVVVKNKGKSFKNAFPYVDENYFISFDVFLNQLSSLNSNFEGVMTDSNFNLQKITTAITATHTEIGKAKGSTKKSAKVKIGKKNPQINHRKYDNIIAKNELFTRFLMNNEMIEYLNKIEDFQLFSILLNAYVDLSMPFKLYEFVQYLLENLNTKQAEYLTKIILTSNQIPERLYNNNPIFLFQNVYDLVKLVFKINKGRNLKELIQIVNHLKNLNIYFSTLFDIVLLNVVESEVKHLCLKKKIKSSKAKDETSYMKLLFSKLDLHFPNPKHGISKSKNKIANIYGIYNLMVLTKSTNEKHLHFLKNVNQVLIPTHSSRKSIVSEKYQTASNPKTTESNIEKPVNIDFSDLVLTKPTYAIQYNFSTVDQDTGSADMKTRCLNIVKAENENNLHLYNSIINKIFDKYIINLNYKMAEVFSSDHYRNYLDLFWNISNYYIDTHTTRSTMYSEQEDIIEIVFEVCRLIRERYLKDEMNEIDEVALLKNFVYKFEVKQGEKISDVLNSFKSRLQIFKEYGPEQFKKDVDVLIMNNDSSVIFGRKYNGINCLCNKIIQALYAACEYEIFPYLNYPLMNEICAKSYSKKNTIEYINVFQTLYINNQIKDIEETFKDINDFIDDMSQRNNIVFIISNENNFKERFKDFNVFHENFKQFTSRFNIKELLSSKNKNYYLSSFSSTLYYPFLQTNSSVFSQNPELFCHYLSFFAENDAFVLSNKNSAALFLKIIEILIRVYDTLSKNQEISINLSNLFLKILSNIITGINNATDKTKLEEYEMKNLVFTLTLCMKLRSEDSVKTYFDTILSLNPNFLKDLLIVKSFQSILALYTIYSNDLASFQRLEETFKTSSYLTDYYNLKTDSLYGEITVRRNKFTKALKVGSHSNMYYFALFNSASTILSHFKQKMNYEQLKNNYLARRQEEKMLFGLDKVVVLSRNIDFINEFKDIIEFTEYFYWFLAKEFTQSDIPLINSLIGINNFNLDTFVLNCAEKGNNELFINFFSNFEDKVKLGLFDITLHGGNLLHILARSNNFNLFVYLKESPLISDAKVFENLLFREYEECTPFDFCIRNKHFEMYILLEGYHKSEYILSRLYKESSFAGLLIEKIEAKNVEFNDFIAKYNKNILTFANTGSVYKYYINGLKNYSGAVTYKKEQLGKGKREAFIPKIVDETGYEFDKLTTTTDEKKTKYKESSASHITSINLVHLGLSYILSRPKKLDANFLSLFNFNEVNNLRIVYYFFFEILRMNFNATFYQDLLNKSDLINESLFFDLLFYNEKRGNKIFDVVKYYQSQNLENVIIKNSNLSLENFDKGHIDTINEFWQTLSGIEDMTEVRQSFHENVYILLFKAVHQNYVNLSNFLYMKVLNYQFDIVKILCLIDENSTSLSNDQKNSFPLFIFNNFVLITQQLLTSSRYLFASNFNEIISLNDNHCLSILYQKYKLKNDQFLLNDNNLYSFVFNDFITGNIKDTLISQMKFTEKHDEHEKSKGKNEKKESKKHFWSNVIVMFQKYRNQIKELETDPDFRFFLNDQHDTLKFHEYEQANLEDIYGFLFDEYKKGFAYYFSGTETKAKYNLFDMDIDGLKWYNIYFYEYLKITGKKFTNISTPNVKFNGFIDKMSSFFNMVLNFSSICEELAYQIEIFHNRLATKRSGMTKNVKTNYDLKSKTNKLTYKICFKSMLEHIDNQSEVTLKKNELVTEFINCIDKYIKSIPYHSQINIPFHIRTDDLTLVDTIMNVSLHNSLSKYFTLYFDLLDSILFNTSNLINTFPDQLLFAKQERVIDETHEAVYSAGVNEDQIIDIKNTLLQAYFLTGKLSFDIEELKRIETSTITRYLIENSGIVANKQTLKEINGKVHAYTGMNDDNALGINIKDILVNNNSITNEIQAFISDINNYQIYYTFDYFSDFIDFNTNYDNKKTHLAPYVFTGFEVNVKNLFYSNDKFDSFLIDLVGKVSFLREIYLKFPTKQVEVRLDTFFTLVDNLVKENSTAIEGNPKFNARIIKNVFCGNSLNSIKVMLDFILNSLAPTFKAIIDFEPSYEVTSSGKSNNQSLIDTIFHINDIKIVQNDISYRITFKIYSKNLKEEVFPVHGGIDQIFSNMRPLSYNKEICEYFEKRSDIWEPLLATTTTGK